MASIVLLLVLLLAAATAAEENNGTVKTFDIFPANAVGEVGGSAQLFAAPTDADALTYYLRPDGVAVGDSRGGVYEQFSDKYLIDAFPSVTLFNIFNLEYDDAGRYGVYIPTYSATAYAEVMVLEDLGGPETTITPLSWGRLFGGDVIAMYSRLGYRGLWAPVQVWRDKNGVFTPLNNTDDGEVAYQYETVISIDNVDDFWRIDSDYLSPPEGAIPDDSVTPPITYYARNAPEWSATTQRDMTVYVPPVNTTISPQQTVFNPNDVLTCQTVSEPAADFTWVVPLAGITTTGSELTLTREMFGVQQVVCVAEIEVNNQRYTNNDTINIQVVVDANGAYSTIPDNSYGTYGNARSIYCGAENEDTVLYWVNNEGWTVADTELGVYPDFDQAYNAGYDPENNRHSLTIRRTLSGEIGRYGCLDPSTSSSAYAELIVGEYAMECNSDPDDWSSLSEGDTISLECESNYNGLWAPIMRWTDSNDNTLLATNLTTDVIVVYSFAKIVTSDDSGTYWTVDLYFTPPPEGAVPDDVITPPFVYYSRTAPDFTDDFTSQTIVVS